MTDKEKKTKIKKYEFEILMGYVQALWEATQTYNIIFEEIKNHSKEVNIDWFSDMGWKQDQPTRDELLSLYEIDPYKAITNNERRNEIHKPTVKSKPP